MLTQSAFALTHDICSVLNVLYWHREHAICIASSPIPSAQAEQEIRELCVLTAYRRIPQAAGYGLDPMLALSGVSESGRDLLSRLLDVDDDRRISVQDALRHPWVREVRPSCT